MRTLKITDFQKIKELVDDQVLFLYVCDYWNVYLIKNIVKYGINIYGVCACYPKEGVHEPTNTIFIQPTELHNYPNSFILVSTEYANERISYLTEHGFPVERIIEFSLSFDEIKIPLVLNEDKKPEFSEDSKFVEQSSYSNSENIELELISEFIETSSQFKQIQEDQFREVEIEGLKDYQTKEIPEDDSDTDFVAMEGIPNKTFNFFSCLNKYSFILLILVLLAQFTVMFHSVGQKNAYHVDEMLSLAQANGRLQYTQINEEWIYHRWMSSEELMNFFTVQHCYRFDFANVYRTLSTNVHPPFFHMQIHFVSSLFPNQFNNFMLSAINMFWLLGTTVIVYLMAKLLFKNNKNRNLIAIVPSSIWAFSRAMVTYTVFFRMYSTQIFFMTTLTYLGLLIIDNVKSEKKTGLYIYVTLFPVIFLGMLTIHLYTVYLAFTGLFLIIWLLLKKQFKTVMKLVVASIIPILTFLIAWPYAFYQTISSDRGVTGVNALNVGAYLSRIRDYFSFISNESFGGILGILLIIMVFIVLLAKIIYKVIGENKVLSVINTQTTFMFISVLGYLFVIAQIAPNMHIVYASRYIAGIHPVVIVFVISLIMCLANLATSRSSRLFTRCIVAITIAIILIFNIISWSDVRFFYNGEPDIGAQFANYGDSHLVVIALEQSDQIDLPRKFLDFANFDNIILIVSTEYLYPIWRDTHTELSNIENLFIANFINRNQQNVNLIFDNIYQQLADFELEFYTALRYHWDGYRLNIYRVVWQTD